MQIPSLQTHWFQEPLAWGPLVCKYVLKSNFHYVETSLHKLTLPGFWLHVLLHSVCHGKLFQILRRFKRSLACQWEFEYGSNHAKREGEKKQLVRVPLPQARSGGWWDWKRWSCCPHARQLCNQRQRSAFSPKRQESRGLAHPVFLMCMRTPCKRQRKPRCIKTKCLRPGEFTQRVAINPPSQIFLSNSAITMPIKCNCPVTHSLSF